MTHAFKWILIGFALVFLGTVYYGHVTKEPEIDRRDWVTKSKTYRKAFYPTNDVSKVDKFVFYVSEGHTNDMHPSNWTQVIKFDQRGEKEIAMCDQMNMTLLELGLEKDERTVRQLVLARVKADWSTTPNNFKESPDWAALQAHTLKTKISRLLNTTDALTIKRVLESPIGPEIPPMGDFEVRQGEDAVWKEIHSF